MKIGKKGQNQGTFSSPLPYKGVQVYNVIFRDLEN